MMSIRFPILRDLPAAVWLGDLDTPMTEIRFLEKVKNQMGFISCGIRHYPEKRSPG